MAKHFNLTLSEFGGLNLPRTGEEPVSENESPDMKNFRITGNGQLKLREGFRTLQKKEGPVRCLWHGTLEAKTLWLALIRDVLYQSTDGFTTLSEVGRIEGEENVSCLEFREKLYFLTGEDILVFDGKTLGNLNPYRPLIRIASPPSGGGVPFEDVNALSPKVRQTFSPDGVAPEFKLAEKRVLSVDYVLRDGRTLKEGEDYETYPQSGLVRIWGENGEDATASGTENIEIGYTLWDYPISGVLSCRHGVTYGGDNDTRAFLYGNPNKPAVRYYSGIVDGFPSMEYFPVSNLSMVGDGEEITSIVRHYDRQIIFTPHATYYSYPVTHTDETGKDYTSFPVYTLSAMRGNCVRGLALLIDNKPLSVMDSGLFYWSSTSVRDERNAVCFSEKISPALTAADCKNARLFLRSGTGELYIVLNRGIYVYNLRKKLFYYYEGYLPRVMTEDASCRCYFGTDDGRICVLEGFTDDGRGIEAHWKSSKLSFSDKAHTKNLFDVSLGLSADSDGTYRLKWTADNALSQTAASSPTPAVFSRLMQFSPFSFSHLSFDTARKEQTRRAHVGAKRFSSIALTIEHPKEENDLCVTHLILRGKINDQRT